ncbi:MAG: metallophosphoesterase [Cyclobacteriaceae bacterium]|nr:metallophosphoesterase [Cyclobacteriaceae bacterium]
MKGILAAWVLILISPFSIQAQRLDHPQLKIDQPSGAKPWTNRNINDKSGQFQFAIVTDRTGGHRPGVFEDGVRKLNLLQPEFVMSVGDLIEGYTTDTVELIRQWDEFDGFVNQLSMPFFYVPGNHDLTNPVQVKIWNKRYGPTHYSFIYKDILFMALNSEDQTKGSGKGTISDKQYDWIKNTLAANAQVKWTFLFMHQPLWVQEADPARWFDVEKLLKDRAHTVFVGHRHHYVQYERNNSRYYMLATTGGASPLRGPQFGEFDHFVWVTMTDRGPILANLQLEGIFDDQLYTEKTEAFISKVWASEIVRVEPLYTDNFKRDSIRFRLTNPFDVPVTIKLSNGFSWDMKADLPKPEITLPPNSVSFTSLDVELRKSKSLESIKPVRVKAEVAVKDATIKSDLFIPFEFNVAPLKKYQVTKVNKPVVIDGNLGEWQLPYTLPSAEKAHFGIAYDNQYVYLAVQVNDSEVIAPAQSTAFNQDFVGFVLDAQPLAKSAADKGEAWFANSLYFITGPEDETGKNSVWDMSESEKELLKWKCIRNGKGYAFEVAIPITYVQKLQGNNWQTLRLNVVVQDKDSNSETKRVFWYPNWREGDNIPGSGMFFRK